MAAMALPQPVPLPACADAPWAWPPGDADAAPGGWQAALDLRVEHRAGQGAVLARARHQGPLRVQKPLYPEGPDICHTVLLHPPGGVAGGDRLHIALDVGSGAHALLTTPGATRWYKAQGRPAVQKVSLRVAQGGILEWLPQENMLFAGAHANLELDVHLESGSRAIGWDAVVLGRYGAGEHWAALPPLQDGSGIAAGAPLAPSQLTLHNAVWWRDVPLWIEQGRVQAGEDALGSPAAWAGFPISAAVWASGEGCTAALAEALADELPWQDDVRAGVSLLASRTPGAPAVLLVRVLARRMEAARAVLLQTWQRVRPAMLGVPARPLRLWAT